MKGFACSLDLHRRARLHGRFRQKQGKLSSVGRTVTSSTFQRSSRRRTVKSWSPWRFASSSPLQSDSQPQLFRSLPTAACRGPWRRDCDLWWPGVQEKRQKMVSCST